LRLRLRVQRGDELRGVILGAAAYVI